MLLREEQQLIHGSGRVTPTLSAVYEELCRQATLPPHAARAAELRAAFLDRSGRFDPDHPAAERRDAAAWEDAVVGSPLGAELALGLADPYERQVAHALLGAQRGVFVFERIGSIQVARDLWQGAQFVMDPTDDFARAPGGEGDPMPCQGRIAAMEQGCSVLSGAVFHPAAAREEIERTLDYARSEQLDSDAVLDALLRMEYAYQTLARVKVRYAYRAAAL